jgi:NodT family efflux transporter outer membrane factor (OMF) lipoprotein
MKTFKLKTILLLCILPLSACTVGPKYLRPDAPLSANFKEAHGKTIIGQKQTRDWKLAQPCDDVDRGAWWQTFHDPVLNSLETKLNDSNQTIKNAYANFQQARSLVDAARASYWPMLSSTINADRQRTVSGSSTFDSSSASGGSSSGTVVAGTTGRRKTVTRVSTTHSVLFSGAWEPDFWGLIQRQVEVSATGAEASAALLATTRLSTQTSLAQIYFELRSIDNEQKLLNDTVKDYKKTLRLTKNQYAAGVAAKAAVVQAESQLQTAKAQAINNGILRAQYEHAIAVLIGLPPAEFTLKVKITKVRPPAIPLALPSELLERRPDIAQAERLMQQANASIGVNIGAYYPAINLLGTASVAGTGLSHWFSLPMLAWSYGPQLTQLIIDGGLRSAQTQAARYGYDATVATYRQTVLTAFQQVEDNIASLRLLASESIVQNQAAASAREALRLVINQYKAGTVPYSSVIGAQITAYTAELTAANVNYQRMTVAVALISALGGGWTNSQLPAV